MPYLGGNLRSSFIKKSNDFYGTWFPCISFTPKVLSKSYAVEGDQFQAVWPKTVTN